MSQYISAFQSLTAKIQWNEATFLSQFKEGLLNEVQLLMLGYWTSLRMMPETQTKAMTAYQNLLAQHAIQNRAHAGCNIQVTSVPPPLLSSPSAVMDLDHIHMNCLSTQECQCQMDNKLCLYCGTVGHFANKCPRKAQLVMIKFSFSLGNEQA